MTLLDWRQPSMPDRPTLEHRQITAIEMDGRPVEITSAQLVYTQYWDGEQAAQREWEVLGRTHEEDLKEGVESIVVTVDGKRLKGRAVMQSSRSYGLSVFSAVGLGELTDA
jgi:hypothetical protein